MNIYIIEYNEKILGVYNDYNQLELFLNSSIQNNFINDTNLYVLLFNINSCYLLEKKPYRNKISKINNNEQLSLPNNTNSSHTNESNTNNTNNANSSHTNESNTNNTNNANSSHTNESNTNNTDNVSKNISFSETINAIEPIIISQPINASQSINAVDVGNDNLILNDQKEKIVLLAEQKKEILHKINLLKLEQNKLKNMHNEYECDIKLYNIFKNNLNKDNNFIIPKLFENKYKIMNKLENENKLSWDNYYNIFIKSIEENNYELFNDNPYNDKF